MSGQTAQQRELSSASPGLSVLVVDDEPLMRSALSRMLEILGHRPTCVRDGEAAADYFRANARSVDLVLLDCIMPGMSGSECFKRLKELDPNVRVVLSTATPVSNDERARAFEGISGFIEKPYGLTELSRAVAEAARLDVRGGG